MLEQLAERFKNIVKIITHPGDTHSDDFYTACIASFLCDAPIYRCEPTEEELSDKNVLVFDVGRKYEPELNNFDHHQKQFMPCAFHLFIEHLGIKEEASSVWKWFNTMNLIDTRGIFQTAVTLGCTPETIMSLCSPVEVWLLVQFRKTNKDGQVSQHITELMAEIGKGMLTQIQVITERLKLLEETVSCISINGQMGIIIPIEDKPNLALWDFCQKRGNNYAFAIYPDERGEGTTFYRFNDNPFVDFTRIEHFPEIKFSHKGGFIAVTHEKLPMSENVELIREAICY